MKNLLFKEFRLALHPTVLIFFCLSAMMLIPSYPYYVTFFYTTLGVFFTCLGGRENHDIFYGMTLPVSKRDLVSARMGTVVIVELLQFVIAVPFAVLRQTYTHVPPNEVGMEANIALFGSALVMIGLFNLVFFTGYYKNPEKVGGAFVKGSVIVFVYMMIAEVLTHIIPFVKDKLDTYDTVYIPEKLIVLGAGLLIFAGLTFIAYKKSVSSFEKLDL